MCAEQKSAVTGVTKGGDRKGEVKGVVQNKGVGTAGVDRKRNPGVIL